MRIALLSFLVLISLSAYSQTDTTVQTQMDTVIAVPAERYKVYTYVEDMPHAPYDLNQYLRGATRYPITALVDSIEGSVYVQLNVTEIGLIDSIRVIRGVRQDIDASALNTVRNMPVWKPGHQGGMAVAVRMVVPVRFKMPRMVHKEDAAKPAKPVVKKPASGAAKPKPKVAKGPVKKK